MAPIRASDRRFVEAYLLHGSWKAAAEALHMSEGNLRSRASKAFDRHGARNITELTLLVLGAQGDLGSPRDTARPRQG